MGLMSPLWLIFIYLKFVQRQSETGQMNQRLEAATGRRETTAEKNLLLQSSFSLLLKAVCECVSEELYSSCCECFTCSDADVVAHSQARYCETL